MKQALRLVAGLLLIAFASFSGNAQTTGTVYRDYNGNGTRQTVAPTIEPLVAGIIVNAYNSSDALIASFTTTSAAAPNYSIPTTGSAYNGTPGSNTGFIPAGTAVRLEFIITTACGLNPNIDYSTANGSTVGSSVRFTTGGTTGLNYAIQNPADYIGASTNPLTFTSRFSNGDPNAVNPGNVNSFLGFPFNNTGTTAPSRTMTATNMGSVWGLAYSRTANRMFASAYVRRHWGLKGSSGQIFSVTNLAAGAITATAFFDFDNGIDGIAGNADDIPTRYNGSLGAIAYGSAGHFTITGTAPIQTITYNGVTDPVSGLPAGLGVIGTNANRGLPNNTNLQNNDPAAFGQVGRVGLGDIEISDDGRFLFVVNLYDRKLYRLTLNSATNPTAVIAVASYTLPAPPARSTKGGGFATTYAAATTNFYTGAAGGGYQRPFGLKFHRGKVYVASITTGETGGTSVKDNNTGNPEYTDLWAYVWEFDAATASFNGTPLLQEPQNYPRGINGDGVDETWKPWTNTLQGYVTTGSQPADSRYYYYSQPMLTGIEFDNDGSMILGLRDRFGDQTGFDQPPLSGPGSGFNGGVPNLSLAIDGIAVGDILRAYRNPAGCAFVMEANGTAGLITTLGASNGQGPSNYTTNNGEFYYQDGIERFNGGAGDPAAWHVNTPEGALAMRPGDGNVATTTMDPLALWSNGICKMSNADGSNPEDYQLIAGLSRVTLGKASALGDLEILLPLAPLEIGNRIWNDANGNGIQDAGEAGINAVSLELFVDNNNDGVPDGAAIATTTTNAAGEWYFNNGNITGDGDPNTAGVQTAITPGVRYLIRPAAADWTGGAGAGDLLNYRLTGADIVGNGAADLSDNDAALNGTGASAIPQISVLAGLAGQNNHNLDFGFKQLGAIGDKVWLDNGTGTGGVAGDGLQNGNEPGVAGVTVELFLNGVRIAGTVTDAYGNYFFDNLATGGGNIYSVKITPPANYRFTTQTNTTQDAVNDATGSDVNPLTGTTSYNITLTTGEVERDIDAGLVFNSVTPLPSIGDRVWLDNGQGGGTANDGIQNGTETGVAGVTVTLYRDINNDGDVLDANEIIATAVTDANGNYLFTNLPPNTNNYQVGFTLPPTFAFSPKDAGGNDAVDSDVNTSGVNAGRTDFFNLGTTDIVTVDAGINNASAGTTASVGDRVWNDVDQDGVQDANEPGIEGVLVTLLQNGSPIATARTDAFGNFEFTNLTPGTGYELVFTAPAGYTTTTQDVSGDTQNSFDSDINTGTGSTGTFPLVAGQRGDFDAGYYNNTAGLNSLGNFVWYDLDGDGVQDANEPGVPGVSVLLRTATGGQVDNPYRAGTQDYIVTTDENGFYRFTDLPNGNYVAIFGNLPAGYTYTTPTGAGDNGNNTNSDVTAASGTTAIYNLTGGEFDATVDAGLVRGSAAGGPSLGNKVWYDLNNNGIQDAGELGVAGVTVTLNSPGINGIIGDGDDVTGISTTTTDVLGNYLFTSGNVPGGLQAGIPYYLQFTGLPTGYTFSTPQNAGTNDETDSDILNTGTGTTGLYILSPTEENLTVDAGINNPSPVLGSISNFVFIDADGDGVQDAGEPGVPGVTVRLFNDGADGIAGNADDVFIGTTTTDINGAYLFDGLAADNYTVYFSNLPAGFTGSGKDLGGNDALDSDAPGTGKTDAITLAAGQDRTDIDFGIRSSSTATLGNFVWFDSDNDGVQDAGEPGIAGVSVLLYRPGFGLDGIGGNGDDAQPVASAITDANGGYLFTNLVPGTYQVGFTDIPGGTTFTTQDQTGGGGNDTNDSDVNPSTGLTGNYVLAAGDVNLSVDAGVQRQTTATVGTTVWYDLNGNGLLEANESRAGGVTVSLISGGVVVATAVTGNDGAYLFTNVAPGTYTIQFGNLPSGATGYTTQNVGGAGADNNSNPNGAGLTASFTVPAGGADITIDAGLIGAPLAVDGLNLTASLSGNTVSLNWKTLSESNTDYFEVERSTTNSNFSKAGNKIAAAGNTIGLSVYELADDISTVAHNGMLYYRVKLYSKDGNYRYSNVVAVRLKGTGIKFWPNPFAGSLQISISSEQNTFVQIQMNDIAGRVLLQQSRQLQRGLNQLNIDNLDALPSGTYFVRIIGMDNNFIKVFKVTKE